jgi:hypothetical protein
LVEEITTAPALAVWKSGEIRRVLDVTLNLPDRTVLLVAAGAASKDELQKHTEHYTDEYLSHALIRLHVDRAIEFNRETGAATLTAKGRDSRLTTAYQDKKD